MTFQKYEILKFEISKKIMEFQKILRNFKKKYEIPKKYEAQKNFVK